jgi:hypothetical protein
MVQTLRADEPGPLLLRYSAFPDAVVFEVEHAAVEKEALEEDLDSYGAGGRDNPELGLAVARVTTDSLQLENAIGGGTCVVAVKRLYRVAG